MAVTLEQLEKALRKAHEAGDTAAASRFAKEIQARQRAEVLDQPTPREEFDKLPWYGKVGQAADDGIRMLANAMTLGYADKLAGAVSGDPELERIKTKQAQERAGSASTAFDILGLFAPSATASKAVGAAIPALRDASRLLPTLGRETVAGSAVGAGMAAGHDEDITTGAAAGAIGGLGGGFLGNMLGRGISLASQKMGNLLPGILSDIRIPRKDLPGLTAEKNAAYQNLDESGIQYSGDDVRDMLASLSVKLNNADIDPELHKRAATRFRRMNKRIGGRDSVSIKDIDTQRQLASRDVGGPYGENEMGRIFRESLTEFVETAKPRAGGPNATTGEAKRLMNTARDLNRRVEVMDKVEEARRRGINSGTFAGEVSPFRQMLNTGTKGMSKEEKRLLENIVRGEGWDELLANRFVDAGSRIGSIGAGATAGGLLAGYPGALAGGAASLVIPPLAKRAVRKFRNDNIEALLDELGGGKTIDSATKLMINRISGGLGGGALSKDVAEKRKRRRKESRR